MRINLKADSRRRFRVGSGRRTNRYVAIRQYLVRCCRAPLVKESPTIDRRSNHFGLETGTQFIRDLLRLFVTARVAATRLLTIHALATRRLYDLIEVICVDALVTALEEFFERFGVLCWLACVKHGRAAARIFAC